MLSHNEKEYLYEIIAAIIGENHSIKIYKNGFNENTVSVIEEMIETNSKCNSNMRDLVKDLLGASAIISRGWLKKFLKASKKKISKTELRGYGCLVSIKSRWITAIISSTI